MNNEMNQETKSKVEALYEMWLDQIDIRNNAKAGSAKYRKASDKADDLEDTASMLVFGDMRHTMSEAYEMTA